MEGWNFKIDIQDKVLEIESGTDGLRIRLKMIDTAGGHYTVVLETGMKKDSNILYLKDTDLSILFLEDEEGDLCSFKAVRKIHEVNRHKSNEQLLEAYHNAG